MQKTVVIGAAGTGKTYLLIESVTRLLDEEELGVSGGKILVLTSSPHAAGDIRSRLGGAHPDCYADVVIHTVRSLCEAVLKDSDPEIQILSDFGTWFILRERIRADSVPMRSSYIRVKDKRSFIREILELMEATSVSSISMDQLPPVPDEANVDQAAGKLEDIKGIYKYYKDYCERHNLTPAFDVIPRASDLLSEYGEQFSHIFIDQCEDLCPGEVQAIKLLSGDHANVTIFVDAVRYDPDSVSKLWRDDGQWVYRSIGQWVNEPNDPLTHGRVSADMGRHVNRLLRKTAYPEADGQDDRAPGNNDQTLIIGVEETVVDEAEYIARTIKREHDRLGRKYADFAILCREVENLGGSIRDALKKYSIPYSGGVDVSQDPVVRFALLCLQVVAEPHEDSMVLKWLCSPIARLDRADVYRAYAHARKKKQELLRIAAEQTSLEVGARRAVPLLHKSGDRLKELLSILDFVRSELRSGRNIWELVSPILARAGATVEHAASLFRSGEVPRAVMLFIEMIRDIEATYEERPALPVILNDIKVGLIQISSPDCSYICEDSNAVRIMSIWESRGLEFPFVFLPGMVDNFFPARHPARQLLYGEDLGIIRAALRGIDLPGTISPDRWQEQERQLLYIAMTRAKEKVYLTLAHQYPENEDCEPSRFLTDLLGGKEISVDNCAHYNMLYQDRTVSISPDGLPSLDDITSRGDLEIACCRYIRELEQFDHQKAEEVVNILSNMGAVGDMLPPAPLKEVAIPQSPSQRFSHTYIRSFLSCPRRYFLAHLLKLEADYGPGALFGGLVHDVLKEFHKQYPRLCDYDLEELWEDMRKILSDAWDDKVEAEFAGNRLQAQSYLRLAGEVLRAYLQAEHGRWDEGRSCIRTENHFGFLFLDKYNLTGRIDRIDACAPGDEIIDFKTSLLDKEGETALKSKFLNMDDDPNYQPQDYQLPIYYLAGLNDRDLRPERVVVYQLQNFSRRSGEPFRRELEILLDEDARSGKKDKFLTRADLESVKDDILQTLERMMSGIYPPEPREDRVCEGECEFSFLCDKEGDDRQ